MSVERELREKLAVIDMILHRNALDGVILNWKEAIQTRKRDFHFENYMKFPPPSSDGKPVYFCVEFIEKTLTHAEG